MDGTKIYLVKSNSEPITEHLDNFAVYRRNVAIYFDLRLTASIFRTRYGYYPLIG